MNFLNKLEHQISGYAAMLKLFQAESTLFVSLRVGYWRRNEIQ